MKTWPPLPDPAEPPQAPRRIPAFHPVPVGARQDGWTPRRQAAFVGLLAETGSVLAACRAVGMGRESAYRLRRRRGAAGFAAAWDAALGKPHPAVDLGCAKSTGLDAGYRRRMGLLEVVMDGRRYLGSDWKDDDNFPAAEAARPAPGRSGAAPRGGKPHPATPSHPSTPAVDFAAAGEEPVPEWRSSPELRALFARMAGP